MPNVVSEEFYIRMVGAVGVSRVWVILDSKTHTDASLSGANAHTTGPREEVNTYHENCIFYKKPKQRLYPSET
ncbi:hypothetical protein Q5H93_21590 [Hymenobacter sp. ASUV-10]|uniref:Uncharacterized protein n=1 Tax=Hymenobacter aranciens TaxID=3063996 RepID=A0ABT9BGF6_9BACT|nr:hypothetical protein [Hymenobacter sp. ASUV-10]MDO7877353.1 hypothetical protein [Hymenobacter sp. ASUV-10]